MDPLAFFCGNEVFLGVELFLQFLLFLSFQFPLVRVRQHKRPRSFEFFEFVLFFLFLGGFCLFGELFLLELFCDFALFPLLDSCLLFDLELPLGFRLEINKFLGF